MCPLRQASSSHSFFSVKVQLESSPISIVFDDSLHVSLRSVFGCRRPHCTEFLFSGEGFGLLARF
jgi:hypothetical protein